LDLPTAARVVWQRGRLMQQATGLGQMASVGLTEPEAVALLESYGDRLSIGAINSPRSIVLSGESAALGEALATLERRGVAHRMLPVK
jgi:acyl transferase domain-containing protein